MLDWLQFVTPPLDLRNWFRMDADHAHEWLMEDVATMRIGTLDFAAGCLREMSDKQIAWMQGRLRDGKTPLEIGREVFAKTAKHGECYRVMCAAGELERQSQVS